MRRASAAFPSFAIGGWLFAELAAVLMMIAMASADPGVAARPAPAQPPAPAVSTTTPAAPTAAPTGEGRGLLLASVGFPLAVPETGDQTATVARFRSELARVVGPDRQVGLVLLFGVSRDPDRPLAGSVVSRQLLDLVKRLPELSQANDIRAYVGDSEDGRPGEVRVELFLLNGRP